MANRGDPSQLRVGAVYARRELHEQMGLGGNWQKGISYPAQGDYALLFSDPNSPYAHLDSWDTADVYLYSGEWSGKGDMRLAAGNLRILERSPNLYLFLAESGGMRHEGRFELVSYDRQRVDHEGNLADALVFRLRRARGGHRPRPVTADEAEDADGLAASAIRLRRVKGGIPASLRPDAYTAPADAARLRGLQEKARQGHRDLLVQLVAAYSQPKTICSEDPFSVDLLVQGPNGPDLLIEVKTLGRHEVSRVRAAVAQLYEYEFRMRRRVHAPVLAVAIDRPLRTRWLIDYLTVGRGITLIWLQGGALEARGRAAAEFSKRSGNLVQRH